MRRVTMKTLQHRVDMLNRMVHLSDKIWHNGKMVPDMFVLDAAYGGYRLCQIVNHEGGERDITGRAGARETYDLINAFIAGFDFALGRYSKAS
jgi:hypothetical protein